MLNAIGNEALYWKKREYISFILSILVFFIHISTFGQYDGGPEAISILNEKAAFFFKESITRFAVPMFFILSGVTFFRDYDNSKYLLKLRARFFSLFIPYIIWNTLWMIFDIICSYTFISSFLIGRKLFEITPINILKGIFLHDCNIPFWFLLYTIVFVIITPLIYLIVRNKYIGMAFITGLTILAAFGDKIPIITTFHYDVIVYYLLGAILGKHYFEHLTKKSNRKMQIFSIMFMMGYIIAKNIFAESTSTAISIVNILMFILASFCIWNITDIFIEKIKPRGLYSRSFPIFAMHTNISAIITKIIALALPYSVFAIPNFIVTVILTVICINVVCDIIEGYLPGIYSVLMGNRTKKTAID